MTLLRTLSLSSPVDVLVDSPRELCPLKLYLRAVDARTLKGAHVHDVVAPKMKSILVLLHRLIYLAITPSSKRHIRIAKYLNFGRKTWKRRLFVVGLAAISLYGYSQLYSLGVQVAGPADNPLIRLRITSNYCTNRLAFV